MAAISNTIESFINELLNQSNGMIEIQRNELAIHFNCAPSQINYVLTTRFTPYKGYYIESRRGEGGYIRVTKVSINEYEDINQLLVNTIGNSITRDKSYHIIEGLVEQNIISDREGMIMKSAIGDRPLSCCNDCKNILRADILKNMLLILVM